MKKDNNDQIICYCFNYTQGDITSDLLANNGKSKILERIMAEKKAGNCQCTEKNPRGR